MAVVRWRSPEGWSAPHPIALTGHTAPEVQGTVTDPVWVGEATELRIELPVGIDPGGIDVRRAYDVIRVPAKEPMPTSEDARRVLVAQVDRIGDELRRSLEYVQQEFGDAPVGRVLAVGEGARLPGLGDRLGRTAGVEVRSLAASDVASSSMELDPICSTPVLCPALGLALYPRRGS